MDHGLPLRRHTNPNPSCFPYLILLSLILNLSKLFLTLTLTLTLLPLTIGEHGPWANDLLVVSDLIFLSQGGRPGQYYFVGSIESTFSQLIANRIAYRNMITGSDVNDDETVVDDVDDDDDDDDADVDDDDVVDDVDVDDDDDDDGNDDDDDDDDDVLVDKYKTLLGPALSTLTSPVPHPITSLSLPP